MKYITVKYKNNPVIFRKKLKILHVKKNFL